MAMTDGMIVSKRIDTSIHIIIWLLTFNIIVGYHILDSIDLHFDLV